MFKSQFDLSQDEGFDYEKILARCEKKAKIVQRYLRKNNNETFFNISIKAVNKNQYKVEISLKSKDLDLMISKTGFVLEKILEEAFNLFKKKLLETIEKLKEKNNQSLSRISIDFNKVDKDLGQLVSKDRKKEFTQRLLPLLTKIRRYLKRFLDFAILNKVIKRGDLEVDDLLDEMVANAYDNYAQKPKQQTLERWLYVLADQVLQKYLSQEYILNETTVDFPEEKIKDEIFQITVDAEGQPQLLEDMYQPILDKSGDLSSEFEVNMDIFSQKNKNLSKKMIKALNHLSPYNRSILEMYILEELSYQDIASIKGIKLQHVKQSIKKSLKTLAKYYVRS